MKLYCYPMNNEYPNIDIKLPKIQTKKSAGYDLYANSNDVIEAGNNKLVKTKIKIKIPDNYCGQIWPRSSLSLNHGIETGAGIIDSDYQGELGVVLFNHSDKAFKITEGMRIAQIVIVPICNKDIDICTSNEDFIKQFSSSERGDGGFGSTGK